MSLRILRWIVALVQKRPETYNREESRQSKISLVILGYKRTEFDDLRLH